MKQLLAALAASITLAGCALHRTVADEPVTITVLSYNIHHGEGLDRKLDLERIAKIITAQEPDLVALQEVDRKTTRSEGIDQAKELGRLTGMQYAFGRAIDYQGGQYGQAILSRWPIREHRVHNVPQRSGREQRIALLAHIDSPVVPGLLFASTHLDHQIEEIRVEQARALNSILAANASSVAILAGDFNAVPESETMKLIFESWTDGAGINPAPTIPAQKPARCIDYVLFRPKDKLKVQRSAVLEEPVASDHRPVLSVLQKAR